MRGDGVGRELDLVGVRPVRIRLHPPVAVVCQTIWQLTGGTRAEHRGSDRLAARVDLERLGGARYIVDGGGYNRARIPSFLQEQKPVPGCVVLEARDTQAPGRRDDTPHPLARKPPCERNAHCGETPFRPVRPPPAPADGPADRSRDRTASQCGTLSEQEACAGDRTVSRRPGLVRRPESVGAGQQFVGSRCAQ